MLSNRTSYPLYILLIVSIVLLVVWILFFYHIRTEAQTLGDKYELLETEKAKETYVRNTSRELRETENSRALLDNFFIFSGKEANFLERLEALALHASVTMKVLSFTKDEKSLHINFDTEGEYDGSYHFLSLLESLPLRLALDSASLAEKTDSRAWLGKFEITVNGYLPQ